MFYTLLCGCAIVASAWSAIVTSCPSADIGYAVYQGYFNDSTNLNIYKGVRYAAPPTGKHRWQPPQVPHVNRSVIVDATRSGSRCPQSPIGLTYTPLAPASEDCLYLDVYAPAGATELPVLVWIHGGGYGVGDAATYDPSILMRSNNNSFITVVIQYRLGAFGFLASDEVRRRGVVNAGILDQNFALKWVQDHISKFGGDPRKVTVGGQSAGGGSVMYHVLAQSGTLKEQLFTNAIAESPYLPQQYHYSDFKPSWAYYSFAAATNCLNGDGVVFDCLVSQSTETLQNASATVVANGKFGEWAFQPVTDDQYIRQLPTQQLVAKQINGVRILTGSVADEGAVFVPTNITTESDFQRYIRALIPLFNQTDLLQLSELYAIDNKSFSAIPFATAGDRLPSAVEVGNFGVGQQQRAFNLYGETTFSCVAYWLTQAFTDSRADGAQVQSWQYQWSYPPAYHTSELFANGWLAELNVSAPAVNVNLELAETLRHAFGKFIVKNDPGWPAYTTKKPTMMNFNVSGGTAERNFELGPGLVAGQIVGDVKVNNTVVNPLTWEAGRGERCVFWRDHGPTVPQ